MCGCTRVGQHHSDTFLRHPSADGCAAGRQIRSCIPSGLQLETFRRCHSGFCKVSGHCRCSPCPWDCTYGSCCCSPCPCTGKKGSGASLQSQTEEGGDSGGVFEQERGGRNFTCCRGFKKQCLDGDWRGLGSGQGCPWEPGCLGQRGSWLHLAWTLGARAWSPRLLHGAAFSCVHLLPSPSHPGAPRWEGRILISLRHEGRGAPGQGTEGCMAWRG